MSDLVWPAVVCVVAVLAFLRFKPRPSPSLREVRKLKKQLARLEKFVRVTMPADVERRAKSQADDVEQRAKNQVDQNTAHEKELKLIKQQVSDRLNAFAEDMNLLKSEFSSIKTKAGLKAVVEAARTG